MTKTTKTTKKIISREEINKFIPLAGDTEDPKVLVDLAKRTAYGVEDDTNNRLHHYLVRTILYNDNTPADAIDIIYKHNSGARVRWLIAHHQNTSPELLTELSNDKDKQIRIEALKNINIPTKVLNDVRFGDHEEGRIAEATYYDKQMAERISHYSPDNPKNMLCYLHDLVFRLGMKHTSDALSDYIDQVK